MKKVTLGNLSGIFLSVSFFMIILVTGCGKDPISPTPPPPPPDNTTVPAAPAGVVATSGNKFVTAEISPSPSDGGKPITGYTVVSNPAGGVDSNAGSTTLVHKITGLTNGTSYTFTAIATNAKGSSGPSNASNAVIPASPRQKLMCDSPWYAVRVLYWKGSNLIDKGAFTDGEADVQWNYYLDLKLWINIGLNNPNYSNIDPNGYGHTIWKFTNDAETTQDAGNVNYAIISLTSSELIREGTWPLQPSENRVRIVYRHRK